MSIHEHLPPGRLLVSGQQALMVPRFPSVLQRCLSFQDARQLTSYPRRYQALAENEHLTRRVSETRTPKSVLQ